MSYDLTVGRLIDAPADDVFAARTDPEIQRSLNAHPISRASSDLRGGGVATLEWGASEEELYRVHQVYREIDRPHQLVYDEVLYAPGTPVYNSVITETFEERGGKTFLTFHHEGFPTVEERETHTRGYHIILDRLEKHFAAKKLRSRGAEDATTP